jgi:hypothetical protein
METLRLDNTVLRMLCSSLANAMVDSGSPEMQRAALECLQAAKMVQTKLNAEQKKAQA